MSQRILGTNAQLGAALSDILAQCPEAPGEPPALPPLEETDWEGE